MDAVEVEMAPNDDHCLVSTVDEETGFLSWTSTVLRPWSRGVNLDSFLMIDCDDAGIVMNVDLFPPIEVSTDERRVVVVIGDDPLDHLAVHRVGPGAFVGTVGRTLRAVVADLER